MSVDATTHATWKRELAEQARAYWTPERTKSIVGDKSLEIVPAEAPVLLRALGLLHRDATMPPKQVRKFLQINHLVRALRPALRELIDKHGTVRILDAGCGRSYLSMLLAWCAREKWQARVEVLGIDRNADVIAECVRRTELAELTDVMRYEAADLATSTVARDWQPHGVVALHACDTATCDAIALGVGLAADLIAVAPCCQAELGKQWTALADSPATGAFAPIWRAPHLRQELASHVTDTMRVLLLRAAGYDAKPLELIASEHTKKNTLIRAMRTAPDPEARAQYAALVAATGGAGIALADRLARP